MGYCLLIALCLESHEFQSLKVQKCASTSVISSSNCRLFGLEWHVKYMTELICCHLGARVGQMVSCQRLDLLQRIRRRALRFLNLFLHALRIRFSNVSRRRRSPSSELSHCQRARQENGLPLHLWASLHHQSHTSGHLATCFRQAESSTSSHWVDPF